jgi:hypothetical protein
VSWPVRTRICLECRAALSDEEQCTWVRHTAVAPSDPAGREKLVEAVWRANGHERGAVGRMLHQKPRTPHGASEEPLWTARATAAG